MIQKLIVIPLNFVSSALIFDLVSKGTETESSKIVEIGEAAMN